MIASNTFNTCKRLLPMAAAILLLAACGQASEQATASPGNAAFSADLPAGIASLAQSGLVPGATLYLDRRRPQALTIDPQQNQAHGEIIAIANGRHRFELRIDLPLPDGAPLPLARASTELRVDRLQGIHPDYPWQLPDADGDGYSSLSELLAGTDWNDPNHHPHASPRLSAHYRLRDQGHGAGYAIAPGRSGSGPYEID